MKTTIDRKFVFTAVNPANGHHYSHRDGLVLCAKDAAVPAALATYRAECERLGCDKTHLESIDLLIIRVQNYQTMNGGPRVPDTIPGAEADRCLFGRGVD